MRLLKILLTITLVSIVSCEDDVDISSAFMEVANTFFSDESPGNSKFQDSDAGEKAGVGSGLGQVLSGLGNLMASGSHGSQGKNAGQGGMDLSMLGPLLQMAASATAGANQKVKRNTEQESTAPGFDFESMMNMASMFMGSNGNNLEAVMGILPMIAQTFSGSGSSSGHSGRSHDHSSHSWYMPPIIENIHVMWDHFSNSELGQTLFKSSGLSKIVGTMTDPTGQIKYDQILESFENPSARRRWIRSMTNFVADCISHVSDPTIQQRYLSTAQFIGNSFLKSQGFPKTTLFDVTRPAESLTRMVNAGAIRYLNVNIDSAKYIKPAISYIQELFKLASEKGFIMSRVNANELSNRLSDTINNDIVSPILKTYRAYKWAAKAPHCASHIFCVINDKRSDPNQTTLQSGLIKASSFPAAWVLSNRAGLSFWLLYGAIQESSQCFEKYPADCNDFHEEEIRVTTEAIHNEL